MSAGPVTGSFRRPVQSGVTATGAITLAPPPKKLFSDPTTATRWAVQGRGLARLTRHPQPTTPAELQAACVRWVVTLFAGTVLFQRFAVPGQPVALLLPMVLVWCMYGLVRGVLDIDRDRFGWWLAAAGITALTVPFQYLLVDRPIISPTSWGLLLTTWLVFVFRIRDRRRQTFVLAMNGVIKVCCWLSGLIIFMMGSQFAGLPYKDWVAQIFPSNLLLQGFVITYPISYGSPYYRGNGWIGLEPSVVSFQLGLGALAATLLRAKLKTLMLLLAAMLATTGASGIAVFGVGIVVVVFSRVRWVLQRFLWVVPPVVVIILVTPFGQQLLSRTNEGTGTNSSAGLRGVAPYEVLWPKWIEDPASVLVGRGPGSSQTLVEETHIVGLLVPTPVKMFFDYGIVGGAFLAAFLLVMYTGGHSRSMSISLWVSLWAIQPGTTTMVFVIAIPLVITWWSPRTHRVLENDPQPRPPTSAIWAPGPPRLEPLT